MPYAAAGGGSPGGKPNGLFLWTCAIGNSSSSSSASGSSEVVVDEEESKEASRAAARAARAAARASRVRVDGELLCVIVLTGAKGCIDVSWLFSGRWGQFAILDL